MKGHVHNRKPNLSLEEQACFECPLSFENPPRDCTWSTHGKRDWSPWCPFQREYAEKRRQENDNY